MGAPTTIAGLKTQGATQVDLTTNDIEAARRSKVVLLNLIDDQSKRAVKGVDSFFLYDEEDHGIEDTTMDGSAQNDLKGGVLPTKLVIDQFKTVPGYYHYVIHDEAAAVDFLKGFLTGAPNTAVLAVEKAAIVALRAIGNNAGHYRQMTGTDSNGNANSVPTVADYSAAFQKLCQELKLEQSELLSIGSQIGATELPAIFGLYNAEATSTLGDLAKSKGFVREVLGVPHFASHEMKPVEHIVFHPKAVSFAIRNAATLGVEPQASRNRTYYGVNISYGVVARQDKRAFVMQSGVAWAA